MATYTRFEELPVWNSAIDLACHAFELCDDNSFNYQGDLRTQLTKAALSVSNNIAEGFERRTTKELLAFLFIARGSAAEFRSMLYVIGRRNRFDHLGAQLRELHSLIQSIGRQLNGWIESLENQRG